MWEMRSSLDKKREKLEMIITVCLYIGAIVLANLTASIFIQLPVVGQFGLGTVFFGAIFTLRDKLHFYGRGFVYRIIGAALLVNVLVAILTGTPIRIIVASFIALALSEATDTEIYQRLINRNWYTRVIGSNAFSIPLDTILFVSIAFAGELPAPVLLSVMFGETVVKAVISLGLIWWKSTTAPTVTKSTLK